MQMPYAPALIALMIATISFAALHDFAQVMGRTLSPWFGWMLP
jgi:hypothetical protein